MPAGVHGGPSPAPAWPVPGPTPASVNGASPDEPPAHCLGLAPSGVNERADQPTIEAHPPRSKAPGPTVRGLVCSPSVRARRPLFKCPAAARAAYCECVTPQDWTANEPGPHFLTRPARAYAGVAGKPRPPCWPARSRLRRASGVGAVVRCQPPSRRVRWSKATKSQPCDLSAIFGHAPRHTGMALSLLLGLCGLIHALRLTGMARTCERMLPDR